MRVHVRVLRSGTIVNQTDLFPAADGSFDGEVTDLEEGSYTVDVAGFVAATGTTSELVATFGRTNSPVTVVAGETREAALAYASSNR